MTISWLSLELPSTSAKFGFSWLAFWTPSGLVKARWHDSEVCIQHPMVRSLAWKNLEWQNILNENDSFNFFFYFFLAAYDHAVLEANTNSVSSIIGAEGIESFSYDKPQTFLGMLFSKNVSINIGRAWSSRLTMNHVA